MSAHTRGIGVRVGIESGSVFVSRKKTRTPTSGSRTSVTQGEGENAIAPAGSAGLACWPKKTRTSGQLGLLLCSCGLGWPAAQEGREERACGAAR